MKKTAPIVATLLTLSSSAALAHHSNPEHGLITSIAHWLTEPDHLLLVVSGVLLAFLGHMLLSRE